ncbi:MAG TPA: PrsW family glutamic-type intramembrane protease [Pirellulales bacterium]|nr:PrsW family glutamic-type intramembrane protease [Pirellulales bacterium]
MFLALIPLAIDTLWSKPAIQDFTERLASTAEDHPEIAPRLDDWANRLSAHAASFEELFNILPNHEVEGAFLPRDSHLHWALALVAAALFFGLLLALFPSAKLNRLSLAGIGLLTATVGVLLLIGFQYAAEWTQGHMLIGRSIVVLIFYIVKFIGFSYNCANDPQNGFLFSFFGFTLGVGLCEEICKAIPLMARFQQLDAPSRNSSNTWQNACLWGMASGVGFGIAEGILYSGSQYNGMSSGLIYLVRFVSCVTLHAAWAGSVGITMFNRQGSLQNTDSWYEYVFELLITISIAMTLHGLYDTLFKKDLPVLALGVAVASFGWFAFQIESMRRFEPAAKPLRAAVG